MSNCNDSWKGKDKALHFGVCFVLAVICPLVSIICAIAKEWHDVKQNGNHWCWKDLAWDTVGIIGGSAIHILLSLWIL